MNLTVRILIGMSAGLVLGVSLQQLGFALVGWVLVYVVVVLFVSGGSIFV